MTESQCSKRHGGTRWLFGFLGLFTLAMLGGAGTAMNTAAEAESKSNRNEARIDSLDEHIKQRLDDIWVYIREDRNK